MQDYYVHENYVSFELPLIMLLCVEGMFLMISSNDLFITYLSIEIQSLSSYILVASKRYSNLSIEAGLRYFIFGSFASGVILFGISLCYYFLGTTNYLDIYNGLYLIFLTDMVSSGIFIGFLFILAGFLFKLGLVPFHYWVADVYEGSTTLITFFLSVLPKISLLIAFYRIFSFSVNNKDLLLSLFSYSFWCLLVISSLLSILIGSVGALYQVNIKRLLAYSAIANMGYILLGFCTLSFIGCLGSLYYLYIYIFTLVNIFSIIIAVRRYPYLLKIKNLVEFVSISHSNFFVAFLLVFSLLSLAGIPPLAGFVGKFLIFFSLIHQGYYFLALYALCFSVLTSIYYIRLIRFLWFVEQDNYPIYNLVNISFRQSLFIGFVSIVNLFFMVFQGPLLIFAMTKLELYLNFVIC